MGCNRSRVHGRRYFRGDIECGVFGKSSQDQTTPSLPTV